MGLTKNLKKRYNDHIKGYGEDNNFNKRFTDYTNDLKIPSSVSELLFISIQFKKLDKAKNYTNKKLKRNLKLIEKILPNAWSANV